MSNVFDYIFNIGGNYTATINGMSTATGDFSAKVDGAQNSLGCDLLSILLYLQMKQQIDNLTQFQLLEKSMRKVPILQKK